MAFQAIACGGFDSTVGRKALQLLEVSLIVAEQGSLAVAGHSRKLRRRRPKAGDTWHLGEVCLRINRVLRYLWRAVNQHGAVLGILVQEWCSATAANRFFEHLLAGLKCKPRKIITDGLRSYDAAEREVLPDVRRRTSRYLGNHPENSPHPPRHRERQMQRFKSPEQAQRFLSAHSMTYGHFRPRRHPMTAAQYRRARAEAFWVWRQETCARKAM